MTEQHDSEKSSREPVELSDVLRDELTHLGHECPKGEDVKSIYRRIGRIPLSALCLSGGGVRSATFNLGILQSLAGLRLLDRFDYLSSVSGGGFVAGWLRTWIHRESCKAVSTALSRPSKVQDFDPLHPEPEPLAHLRVFSNYLTPRVGLFSADTWAAAAMVVRNLILNWLVLVPALATLVLIPQTALVVSTIYGDCPTEPLQIARQTTWGRWALVASIVAGLISSAAIHHFRRRREPSARGSTILLWGLLPLWLAAAGLCLAVLWLCPDLYPESQVLAFCALWCIVIPLLGWLVSLWTTRGQADAPQWQADLFGLLLSGVVVSGLLFVVAYWWVPSLRANPRLFTIVGVPVLLGLYLLARSLFVVFSALGEYSGPHPGVLDRDDADREWWARLSGLILLAAVTWMVVGALVILGAELTQKIGVNFARSATFSGVLGLITSMLAASPETSGGRRAAPKPQSVVKEVLVRLLAPVTIACILLLLATLTSRIGLTWTLVSLSASWLLGWVVNVNRFSAHGLYRSRIVRAYLGASNPHRTQDNFTGFDPQDNLRLHELDDGKRPIPVLNGTLN
ncbi:MAG TPA: patatin-like phospholipase family protein, partial [Thermoanaerobaculia bacterium]|nr:patatin-like phospholipase family protein [Thermoanaerobaculia bacterium]